jgi:hypothetical protein
MVDKAGDAAVKNTPAKPAESDAIAAAHFAEADRTKASRAISLYLSYRRALMSAGARDADVSAGVLVVHHMEDKD